jgi:hypothetical protein
LEVPDNTSAGPVVALTAANVILSGGDKFLRANGLTTAIRAATSRFRRFRQGARIGWKAGVRTRSGR